MFYSPSLNVFIVVFINRRPGEPRHAARPSTVGRRGTSPLSSRLATHISYEYPTRTEVSELFRFISPRRN